MSSTTTTGHDAAIAHSRPLIWARIGSLVSILPLGFWTVAHLWNNLSAFQGAQAWEKSVVEYQSPVSMTISLIIVLLPLVLHTIWGLQRLASARPNNGRYGTYGNFKYALQRLAGIGVLFFLGAHIWLAFLHPRLVEGHGELFSNISQEMHFHTPTLIVYLLGTAGVSYHLANGLQTFFWTWGLAAGRESMKRMDRVALVLFVVLLAMSWGVVYALYTAGEAYGPLTALR